MNLGKSLSDELEDLSAFVFQDSYFDGISLESTANRFSEFEKKLPKMEEMTPEQMEFANKFVGSHKKKVGRVLRRS
ncbi:MAG: hypothetical protein RLN96_13485 [Pseudomonadales bacterium]